ncbi:dual 3',5'-cyclic-AMP and -GMP phosphodiesterase 11A-like [Pomacea canaliculata]|uniref:dual 3',5'-cyclic-AMP and -GMP phosphodiesterase 11A-like n=1 Tax=Pomacea canaliculata TaxID=400727 RepID=UPI000D73735F|nr:dual 3',5'-cyclic-AMP and -GMP phosphodiesterase 11A-like [Pomacea canaliculata]
MAHTSASVEDWLDANPDVMEDYFLRKADIGLVNRWLTQHGLNALPEMSPVIGKHMSLSADSSAPSSPVDTRFGESGFFESRHHRSNSKKFRTYEPTPDSSAESRRSSLKEMRQFRSLPPTSVNMLSLLIQSKVRLPRYPSKDIDHKRELRYTNERAFFLEIVKDISNDLDLKSLSSKMVANMCCLTDADKASLFLVEGRHGGRPSLVSKIFDVHAGTSILPSTTGDTRIPWGQGIIGHVAQTGEMVSLRNAMEVLMIKDLKDGKKSAAIMPNEWLIPESTNRYFFVKRALAVKAVHHHFVFPPPAQPRPVRSVMCKLHLLSDFLGL